MRRRESGYAFLIVLLLAAMVLISLSVAVPRILTQGQRMKEDELIFRGQEYQKAIGRFYRKFGRYPNSIEELLRTNDRAFLRREYRDPMTEEGKWRLIRVAPNGALIGSVTRRFPAGAGGAPGDEDEGDDEDEGASPPPPVTDTDDSNLPIAGVASRNHARSIKVYNGFSTYYEWEFIYDAVQDAAGRAGQGQQPTPPGQPPGQGQTRPPYPPRR